MANTIYENGEWVPAHWHHIIPVHMGGTDDPENLVLLSIPKHAEAHRILFEKYGRWQDETAWLGLAGMIGKEEIIHQMCVENGKRRPSPETKEKMRISQSGKHLSPETKEKIRISNSGKNHPNYGKHLPQKTKDKISKSHKGKHHSPETKDKMQASHLKYQYTIQCPDGEIVTILNMPQFCLENGLNRGIMYAVANGKRRHHKGYKVLEKKRL